MEEPVPGESEFLHDIDRRQSQRIITSRCPLCEVFVAASPDFRIILIAEALHHCQDTAA